jgi:hypothetical protein
VPDPLDAEELLVVGLDVLELQHTPRLVTLPPPSLVTLPPPDAVEIVIEDIELVLTVGKEIALVLKLTTLP